VQTFGKNKKNKQRKERVNV